MKAETRELKQKELERKTFLIYQDLKYIAEIEKLELTDNAMNVARFRARLNIPLWKCPCRPNCRLMGCSCQQTTGIKKDCLKHIRENGKCYCNVFKLKDTK